MILNNKPLVSIIIPSYNHENYIKDTIESIVNQTYKNIELIIIDDGSKDNSIKVIEKLNLKYEFLFIKRENRGLCETLNEGISLSKGKYIAICASDDIYLENKIEIQVDFLENNLNYSMCYGKIIKFADNGEKKFSDNRKCKSGKIFYDLMRTNFVPAVTQMYRKEIFNEVGYFDKNLWIEDWDMLLRIAYKYEIGFIDEYLALYRMHENNMSGNNNVKKMYKNELQILEKWNFTKEYLELKKYWEIKWFCDLVLIDKNEAKKYFLISFKRFYKKKVFKAFIKYIFS